MRERALNNGPVAAVCTAMLPPAPPSASAALFGQRLLLRSMVRVDQRPDFKVLDLTTEQETTAAERNYAVRLHGFIAASSTTLFGASA